MNYKETVEKILKEVEHILIDDAGASNGANIKIEIGRDRVATISYEIVEKVVV